jgi:glycosyltransferase involved in cell wall biosynthesis
MNNPLFTVFIVAYYPPKYLTIAVDSIINQTYKKLEIILVNHGAHIDTVVFLNKVKDVDDRVKIINYDHNLYIPSDPMRIIDPWNKVLDVSTGEYILQLSDDNILSKNYIEKMVALFCENKACTTAAGLQTAIDSEGKIEKKIRDSDYRPRYMPGRFLALDRLRNGKSKMFASPGGGSVFAIKKKSLVDAGGYHKEVEQAIEYGIVPFGVTGFDEDAVYYWRHHAEQTNKLASAYGWIGAKERLDMIKDHGIYNRWKVFGNSEAEHVVKEITRKTYKNVAWWTVVNLLRRRIKPSFRVYFSISFSPYVTFFAIPYFTAIQLKTRVINLVKRFFE